MVFGVWPYTEVYVHQKYWKLMQWVTGKAVQCHSCYSQVCTSLSRSDIQTPIVHQVVNQHRSQAYTIDIMLTRTTHTISMYHLRSVALTMPWRPHLVAGDTDILAWPYV